MREVSLFLLLSSSIFVIGECGGQIASVNLESCNPRIHHQRHPRSRTARKERLVSDSDLLRRTADFLADSIGNLSSADGISNELTRLGNSIADKMAASYIKVLEDAYLFYECRRFDLRGKGLLKMNPKIYLSDVGVRQWLLGGKLSDTGHIFENLVYLQLLYEGYEVQVGKLYQKEIDFVAICDNRRV